MVIHLRKGFPLIRFLTLSERMKVEHDLKDAFWNLESALVDASDELLEVRKTVNAILYGEEPGTPLQDLQEA